MADRKDFPLILEKAIGTLPTASFLVVPYFEFYMHVNASILFKETPKKVHRMNRFHRKPVTVLRLT